MSQDNKKEISQYFYRASAADFMKIPGSPVAYWATANLIKAFENGVQLSSISIPRQGLATMDNSRFTRMWHEVSISNSSLSAEEKENIKWYPYNKGGDFRKWYGNQEILVNWNENGREIKKLAVERYGSASKRVVNEPSYFLRSITWSKISSSKPSFRCQPKGAIFDVAGMSIFPKNERDFRDILMLLNSNLVLKVLEVLSPTLNFEAGQIGSIPIIPPGYNVDPLFQDLILTGKEDWNSYEISWGFSTLHLFKAHYSFLKDCYNNILAGWCETILKVQRLEEENNRLFIEAYGLQNELTPEVPLEEITLTCNPHYRYGGNLTDQEREDRLQSDTLAELVSYAIGSMMGRYSLDKPGLILASQGETRQDYLAQIPSPRFMPDEDAIIPLTDQEWFKDDATNLFRDFIKTAWGDDALPDGRSALQENLDFVAESLCLYAIKPKKGEAALETIRRYLSTQFYKDHLKTYKKRPIYWLFSSGKQKAFECLVYLHRYNEGTLSRMRTEYVTPLLGKYDAWAEQLEERLNSAGSTAESNRLKKELAALQKKQAELREFDDKLKHYADMRISLDLDDGVKVNYGKFGDLLANVKDVTGAAPEVES